MNIPTDFLPPNNITNIFVKNSYKKIELTWEKSNDKRFNYYKIYKNNVFYVKTYNSNYTDIDIKNNIN